MAVNRKSVMEMLAMKNPFPGMNPYLQRWSGDFQTRFIVAIRDALNQSLPDDLDARIEESIAVDFVRPRDDPRTERHIEILDLKTGGRVITAVELLTPENKSHNGRESYRKKQEDFLAARVNLVEIDLFRGGLFVLAMPERQLPRTCHTRHLINVRRATRPNHAAVYSVALRDPLPVIPIPLRPTDSDFVLQLQPLLDECYDRGRYRLNYQLPPDPPLDAEDDAWIDQLLREQGLRT